MNARHGHARPATRTLLATALFACLALPAAAENPCLDSEGAPVDPVVDTDQGSEHGDGNTTCHATASAYGYENNASGERTSAVGHGNTAVRERASAMGYNNNAQGRWSSAFGYQNGAEGDFSSSFGFNNRAHGASANAFGNNNMANGQMSTAFGIYNTVLGEYGIAMGGWNAAGDGLQSIAIGYRNTNAAAYAISLGAYNNSEGVAVGRNNSAALNGIVFGTGSDAGADAVVFGINSRAVAGSVAIGINSAAEGEYSTVLGIDATASGSESVALGFGSVADRDRAVAVGSFERERQIIHVADGTRDTDAINLRQLVQSNAFWGQTLSDMLGGGAWFSEGSFTPPSYVIHGETYHNVGGAFAAVDARLTAISTGNGGTQGPPGLSAYQVAVNNGFAGTQSQWLASLVGPQGPQGPQGPSGPGGPGTGMTEPEVRTLVDAGDAATLAEANTYTDTVAVETLASANAYTDSRFAEFLGMNEARFAKMDRRIDRQAAIAGAYAGMAMNTAGLPGRNRLGVGVGAQGGEAALAIGYQRLLGRSASVSFGGAFGGGEKSVMGGAGFSW